MNDQLGEIMQELQMLTVRVHALAAENESLRQQQLKFSAERAKLLAADERKRLLLEDIIARLKNMEES